MPSAETARLLQDLSALIDGNADLNAGFARVVAGWRAAVDDSLTVSIAVHHDDGSTALVLIDAGADRPAGHAASSLSIPLGAADDLTAVLYLDAGVPSALDRLRTDIAPLFDAGALAGVTRGRAVAGDRDQAAADPLAAERLRNQAIGVLLHRHGGSGEDASARLRALAAERTQSVAETAAEVVAAAAGDDPGSARTQGPPDRAGRP